MQTLSDSEKQEIRSLLETCEGLADELQRKNPFDCAVNDGKGKLSFWEVFDCFHFVYSACAHVGQ